MGKLSRFTQLLFGSTAAGSQIAQFGSFAAGSPVTYSGSVVTPAEIQNLSNYLTGWFGAVIGSNSPTIEDLNAIDYLFSYQLAYLLQEGIAEYDSATTYYQYSLCQYNGIVYQSIINSNAGNQPDTSTSDWKVFSSNPLTTLGDTIYSAANGVPTRLAGNATSTVNLLTQTGTGSVSAAPVWAAPSRSLLPSVGQQVSSSCGAFTTASNTLVAVTNLSVSITTSGRPVMLFLISDGSGTVASLGFLEGASSTLGQTQVAIKRGGTQITNYLVEGYGALIVPVGSILHQDVVGAGTYTYAVYLSTPTGGGTGYLQNAKLVAYEM